MRCKLDRRCAQRLALWARDGTEIFFDEDQTLNVIPIVTQPRLMMGTPKRLSIQGFVQGFGR